MGFFDGLKNLIARPIKRRLKSAIPASWGDRFLMELLGKLLSRPAVASQAYGEGEIFLIKGGLFLSGVSLDRSAYQDVGMIWKEDLGQRHYDPDAGFKPASLAPHAIYLPHGFYMPLYVHPGSPFILRREAGTLYLYLEEMRLFPVELERRPVYYDKLTTTGVPMSLIGPYRLQRQVLVEYNAYCHFFAQKAACLFCGIIAERALLPSRYGNYFAASPAEVAEVIEAAYKEGICNEMQITGGVLPHRAEVPYILEVGRAIREKFNIATIPGSQAVLVPPSNLKELEALREAGWQGVAFNLEVWDEKLWPGIVPGKAALLLRRQWLEMLEYAIQVFGKGQVASVLVAGLEPKTSFLEGVEWLAQRGIYGVPIPWAPAPGSALEGHQTPGAAWHIEITVKTLNLWEKYGLNPQRHSSGGLHYADLACMREHIRQEQRQHPGQPEVKDLRYMLSIEGKLPEL